MIMGCYGIGLGRLMGTIAETSNDENGIIWPEEAAPYRVHLIDLKGKTGKSSQLAENIYDKMTQGGIEVLFDDRDELRAGEKFAGRRFDWNSLSRYSQRKDGGKQFGGN